VKALPLARVNVFRASERGGGKIAVFYADSSRTFKTLLLPGGSGSCTRFSICLSFSGLFFVPLFSDTPTPVG
jgi:hypothetical protein